MEKHMLFIYAISQDGVEQTWLVDTYIERPNGEIELYRGDSSKPFMTLSSDDVSGQFVALDWVGLLSDSFGEEGYEIELDDEITLVTVH